MPKNKIFYLFFVVFIASLSFISGCATVKAPDTPYSAWSAPERKGIRDALHDPIWTSIRERTIDITKPLSLGDFIDIALRNNPTTRKAWQEAKEAEAEYKAMQSTWLPNLTVSATANREKEITESDYYTSRARPDKRIVIDDHSEYGPKSELTILVLDFGARSGAIEQAAQNLLADNYQFNQTLQDLMLEVEKSYYELYSAYSAVAAAKADLKDAKKSLESAEQKFKVGLAAKLDFYEAKASYENARYNLEDAKGTAFSKKGALCKVIGIFADTDFEIADPSREIPDEITKENVTTLIEEALKQRPDIQAARANLRAKKEAIKIANSALWPSLNAGATAEANWYDYYYDTNDKVIERYKRDQTYAGYLTVTWDVFDGFYHLNEKHARQAGFEAEKSNLTASELEASQEVWTTYYNFKTAGRKFEYSESYYESSKVAYDLAFESYKEGLKDILYLLDAQAKLSDSRSKLVDSKKDVFVSIAELAHATGVLYTESASIVEERNK